MEAFQIEEIDCFQKMGGSQLMLQKVGGSHQLMRNRTHYKIN